MVPATGLVAVLFVDYVVENLARRIDGRVIGESILEYDDAWAREHRFRPFRHHGLALLGIPRRRAHRIALIDQHVFFHRTGERIIRKAGLAIDTANEFFERAAFRRQPNPVGTELGNAVGFHGAYPLEIAAKNIRIAERWNPRFA